MCKDYIDNKVLKLGQSIDSALHTKCADIETVCVNPKLQGVAKLSPQRSELDAFLQMRARSMEIKIQDGTCYNQC